MDLALVAAIVGLVVGLITIWVFVRPSAKRASAVADAILGEEAVQDRSGNIIAPERPGLVARTTTLEAAVATLVNQDARLAALEAAKVAHESRITVLEDARVERLVEKAERISTAEASTEALRLIRDRDSIDGETD